MQNQPQGTINQQPLLQHSDTNCSPQMMSVQQSQPQPDQGAKQDIPAITPGIMPQLQYHNMPGKLLSIISAHIPLSIKNKVWSYVYMDLGTLLESTNNPDEEEEYDLVPDHSTNKIAFRPTTKHHNINIFSAWTKTFCVLTELLALKWTNLCLPLITVCTLN